MFDMYQNDVQIYLDYILDGFLPLRKQLSSKELPNEQISHSRWKQLVYAKASSILRSQIKQANNRRYNKYKQIYKYYIDNKPNSQFIQTKFSKLNLKNIIDTKYFKHPKIKNISVDLDSRVFDIQDGNHFDKFVRIRLPIFNEKKTKGLTINLPFKLHKHSNELKNKGYALKNYIQLKKVGNKVMLSLNWFKEPTKLIDDGETIGIDMGANKLLVTSNNQFIGYDLKKVYGQINHCIKDSKKYNRLLKHRDNLTRFYVKQLDLTGVNQIVIESLVDLKRGKGKKKTKKDKNINNYLARWKYPMAVMTLESICMEKGIKLVKVSPAYTSQTCSSCGNINKASRNGEAFKCISCGYEIDADYNAAINIRNLGAYSPHDKEKIIDYDKT